MNSKPLLYNFYIKHVVFRVVHHVGRKRIERYNVSNSSFAFSFYLLSLINNIGVYDFVPWQEIMFHFFLSKMKFNYKFSK